MKSWKTWLQLAVLVAVLGLAIGATWQLFRDGHRKFNLATFCDDAMNGHPQQAPRGVAIDCAGA